LPLTSSRTLAGSTHRVLERTRPVGDARARLPFFGCDFPHHLDFEVTLQQLLEQRVLVLDLPQRFTSTASSLPNRLRQA
jgi:hypothetical protein